MYLKALVQVWRNFNISILYGNQKHQQNKQLQVEEMLNNTIRLYKYYKHLFNNDNTFCKSKDEVESFKI